MPLILAALIAAALGAALARHKGLGWMDAAHRAAVYGIVGALVAVGAGIFIGG